MTHTAANGPKVVGVSRRTQNPVELQSGLTTGFRAFIKAALAFEESTRKTKLGAIISDRRVCIFSPPPAATNGG